MNPTHKVDSTLVLKRVYDVPIEKVWQAWTSASEMAKWYVAGFDHVVHFAEADVRPGGKYRVGFAPPGETPFVESGTYREVVPMKRLVFQESVSRGDEHFHTNETTVELRALNGRTEVTVTISGFEAWRTAEGWVPALEKLAAHLEQTTEGQ